MFRALWGDILQGRLRRLPFLVWLLVVWASAAVVVFVVGAGIAAVEQMAGGQSLHRQLALDESLGPVGFGVLSLIVALLMMGMLNLMAKRARDMGLPAPWLLVLGWLLVSGLLSSGGGALLGGLLSLIVLLALSFVPTGAFGAGGAGPTP
jgi:uncharacterized membrane protein YhaH (DUF805 family)